MSEKEWKDIALKELEAEVSRVQARIVEAKETTAFNPSREWAALKRATLDFDRVGARLRRGFFSERRVTF